MPAHAHLPAREQRNRLVALRLPPPKERRLPLQCCTPLQVQWLWLPALMYVAACLGVDR